MKSGIRVLHFGRSNFDLPSTAPSTLHGTQPMNLLKKAIHNLINLYKRGKAIRPVYPDTVPVLWVSKSSAAKCPAFFSSYKNTFLTVQVNTLTLLRWKKTTTGVKTAIIPATNAKEYDREMMCRVVITGPGLRLRKTRSVCLEKDH